MASRDLFEGFPDKLIAFGGFLIIVALILKLGALPFEDGHRHHRRR